MTRFTIAVFLHLVGMVGLFIGYGLEWVASSLLRRSTNAEEVRAWLRIYRLSLPISGPGLRLLILSGAFFASITESMKQGWLRSSLMAIPTGSGIAAGLSTIEVSSWWQCGESSHRTKIGGTAVLETA